MVFSISPDDSRLPRKERVLGVIENGEAKVYRFQEFSNGTRILSDEYKGKEIVVMGNRNENFLAAFSRRFEDGTLAQGLTPSDTSPTIIMEDGEGNKFDLFGEVIEGPRMGQKLNNLDAYIGYWLAWGSFYPNAEIYDE